MPTYCFQNDDGEQIERFFLFGHAPREIDGYKRIIVADTLSVRFKGAGFTKAGIGVGYQQKNKVTWGEVETIMKEADHNAKENEKKKRQKIKNSILEHL